MYDLARNNCGLSLANSLCLAALNKRRDRKYGQPAPHAVIDVTELADKSPDFRFIT